MRDYDAIYKAAKEGSPFSNSTQGEIWMNQWCYRCKVDAPYQRDESDTGCPLLVVALVGMTPAEWTTRTNDDAIHANYHCSEFVPDDDDEGGGGDSPRAPRPKPVAVMDGQVDMFEVFADGIADKAAGLVMVL